MASEAQILANRRNAQKSTGPRTEEGKAAASQNAVKHGLMARRDVISSEDPSEFDRHRELMLAELDPAGPLEHVLAERIVSLSWRLKRVERMQNEMLDCLLAEGESDELGSFVPEGEPTLGRAAVKDFAGERVLERLMVYERRIEHSLYRTVNELRTRKTFRRMDAEERAAEEYRVAQPPSAGITPGGGGATFRLAPNGPSCQTNPIPAGMIESLPEGGRGTMIVPGVPVRA